MDRDARIAGSSVVISFGDYRARLRGEAATPPVLGAANDDASREPAKTVTVRRTLEKSGVAVKIKVPVEEFIGVAVSTSISQDGVLTSAIELVHADPDLNYRVFEEVGNHSVVAEWQNWGKKLRLPLYIMAGDGSLLPYSQQVDGVLLGHATGRRRLAADAGRRPRFLNRRKPGETAGGSS
jgi:hypothetical protein